MHSTPVMPPESSRRRTSSASGPRKAPPSDAGCAAGVSGSGARSDTATMVSRIAAAPRYTAGKPMRSAQREAAGGDDEHPQAVAAGVHGCPEALLGVGQAFAPVGVDRDVLRGGEQRDRKRRQAHGPQVPVWILHGQHHDTGRQAQLRDDQPAAAAPEAQRRKPVEQRRPEKLHVVGQRDEAEQADQGQACLRAAQPGLQQRQREQQRQAAGESHHPGQPELPVGDYRQYAAGKTSQAAP